MVDDDVESMFLHINRLDTISCFQDLNHVLKRYVHLQVVFTVGLQPIVRETVEIRCREQVEGVFGRHSHVSKIDVPQKAVERLT